MAMADKKVLVIGLDPDFIDFSAPAVAASGVTAEKIRAGLDGDGERLNGLGYSADILWIDDGETAERVLRERLGQTRYDGVLIGAGLRTLPPYGLLFEALVNAVHELAPQARFAFNSRPADTAQAVQRAV
jgi:hypothetical protein